MFWFIKGKDDTRTHVAVPGSYDTNTYTHRTYCGERRKPKTKSTACHTADLCERCQSALLPTLSFVPCGDNAVPIYFVPPVTDGPASKESGDG